MVEWLQKRNILETRNINEMASHDIIHLSVTHYTLNPIEMAWVQAKGYIKADLTLMRLQKKGLKWWHLSTGLLLLSMCKRKLRNTRMFLYMVL